MKPINLRMIEAFRTVYMAGTTSAASEILNMTQPAVSRHIMALEERVGFALFNRDARRLKPTPEAMMMVDLAHSVHGEVERFSQVAEGVRTLQRGHLRILANTTMARGLVPGALSKFQDTYKNVSVSVDIMIKNEMAQRVAAQQFDIALINLPFDYPADRKVEFAPLDGVAIVPRGHPLAELETISAEDFQDYPFISLALGIGGRELVDEAFVRAKVTRNILTEVQTRTLCCDFVAAGLGVAVVDPAVACATESLGIEIRPFTPRIQYDFGIIYPIVSIPSQSARAFEACANAEMTRLLTRFQSDK